MWKTRNSSVYSLFQALFHSLFSSLHPETHWTKDEENDDKLWDTRRWQVPEYQSRNRSMKNGIWKRRTQGCTLRNESVKYLQEQTVHLSFSWQSRTSQHSRPAWTDLGIVVFLHFLGFSSQVSWHISQAMKRRSPLRSQFNRESREAVHLGLRTMNARVLLSISASVHFPVLWLMVYERKRKG